MDFIWLFGSVLGNIEWYHYNFKYEAMINQCISKTIIYKTYLDLFNFFRVFLKYFSVFKVPILYLLNFRKLLEALKKNVYSIIWLKGC